MAAPNPKYDDAYWEGERIRWQQAVWKKRRQNSEFQQITSGLDTLQQQEVVNEVERWVHRRSMLYIAERLWNELTKFDPDTIARILIAIIQLEPDKSHSALRKTKCSTQTLNYIEKLHQYLQQASWQGRVARLFTTDIDESRDAGKIASYLQSLCAMDRTWTARQPSAEAYVNWCVWAKLRRERYNELVKEREKLKKLEPLISANNQFLENVRARYIPRLTAVLAYYQQTKRDIFKDFGKYDEVNNLIRTNPAADTQRIAQLKDDETIQRLWMAREQLPDFRTWPPEFEEDRHKAFRDFNAGALRDWSPGPLGCKKITDKKVVCQILYTMYHLLDISEKLVRRRELGYEARL